MHRCQKSVYYVLIFVVDHYGIHEGWSLIFSIRYQKASSEAEPLQLSLGTSLEVIPHHVSWLGVSIEQVVNLGVEGREIGMSIFLISFTIFSEY